jgi:glycosyltransferase involved in cell wall biosynthesis
MLILVEIPCILTGGTEMQTLQIVQGMRYSGIRIEVVCYFEFEENVVKQFEEAGCFVRLLKWNRDIRPITFILKFRELVRQIKPNLVHVQYMSPGLLPVIATRLAGIGNVIATVHQPHTAQHGKLSKVLLRFSALLCKRFISVSMIAEKSWFGSAFLFDTNIPLQKQSKHFTMYNSVDVDKIQNIQNSVNRLNLLGSVGVNYEMTIVGCVSRLREEKGIDVLVDAFALAYAKNRGLHLLIVGTGPQEEEINSRIEELNISNACTLTGGLSWEESMGFMSCMDVVIVPSRFEGFGLSAAEAMALAKPVIASNVGGLAEVVTDKETGYLFQANNTSDLADYIIEMSESFSKREEMGENGLKKVLEMFDIKLASERNNLLYNQLLKMS